jgi:hypothetical protein
VTVLDIADAAAEAARKRELAPLHGVHRIRADVTRIHRLAPAEVWHDRAVFHFLTDERDRRAYVRLARRTVPLGGHAVISTFALDGPEKCSGLNVARYDARGLEAQFADGFKLVRAEREKHVTPWETVQPFTYTVFQRVRRRAKGAQPIS